MNDRPLRLFIADPDLETVGRIRGRLGASNLALVGSAPSADAALGEIVSLRPDVLLVDDAACADTPPQLVRRVVALMPEVCVIVSGAPGTPAGLMSLAVAAGARGFLMKPYPPEDLFALIREASDTIARARGEVQSARGKLVAVYAPKGGAGGTTVAVNLAIALASRTRRVGLVDLDLQFGDVGVHLNLSGANSIAELLAHPSIGPELVAETFLAHSSGIRVLLAPDDLAIVEGIEPAQVTHALDQLRAHFDVLVCDLWSMYEQLTREVLRAADQVVLVTTPDLPSLRDLQRTLVAARASRLDERSLIVVNRAAGKAGFALADVSRALERPVALAIPSDGVRVAEATNRGLPLLDERAHSRTAPLFRALAERITERISKTPPRTVVPVVAPA